MKISLKKIHLILQQNKVECYLSFSFSKKQAAEIIPAA